MFRDAKNLPHDPDLRSSLAALKRAAIEAKELAKQTGTPLMICHNGKIIDALAEERKKHKD